MPSSWMGAKLLSPQDRSQIEFATRLLMGRVLKESANLILPLKGGEGVGGPTINGESHEKFPLFFGALLFSNRLAYSIWDLSRGDNNFAAIHDEGIGVGHRLKCGKAPSLRAFLTKTTKISLGTFKQRQRIYRYHHQACLREHQPV